ncbi:MAG TPA: 8-amino-7-oxononanoate synthase [Balneolaceae bacterium]
MLTQKFSFIGDALERQKAGHRFRELTAYNPKDPVLISDSDQEFINFSGNDYLALSKHPGVIERSQKYAEKYGAGSTASRLITGTYSIHERLEKKLASAFGWESALLFNSGFQANSTIISSLADRHALILADKLSHNSLLQGSLASRASFRRFEHNSVADLETKLQKAASEKFSRIIVITESLFSMDGDRSDLSVIAELCQKYKALLFVDDAHAMGVWGENGLGFAYKIPGIDMVIGTCGKAFGSFGAFLLCSAKARDYLINFCPGFIYTTSLPPAVIGSIEASLELIPGMDDERKKLHQKIKRMKAGILKAGFSTGCSDSQIIPIMVGSNEKTLSLAEYLKDEGFLATAIRPPTVAKGSARIRITLSSAHTDEQINKFLSALQSYKHV